MINWWKKKSNILLLMVVGLALYQQIPRFKHNLEQEDRFIASKNYIVYGLQEDREFPPREGRAIAIFWASWCGPCKIEMKRLSNSVAAGEIPGDRIFAVNPFESKNEIRKFLNENPYPFLFIDSQNLGKELGVEVTPTTVFFDEGKVSSMSSGMSLWGIWKAERFL